MKPSRRTKYVTLLRETRKPDGYSLEQRVKSLNAIRVQAENDPKLSLRDRTAIRKEARDSIFAIYHPERAREGRL